MHLSLKRIAAVWATVLAVSSVLGVSAASVTPRGGRSAPPLTQAELTSDFSAMAKLKDLAQQGKGKIAVLLPDTQSLARYVQFDAPYLTRAFEAAGLSSNDFSVQNAQGSTQTMQTQAEAAITNGASVLSARPSAPSWPSSSGAGRTPSSEPLQPARSSASCRSS
jgi:D-xylose transport system substrate-binding protein